MDETRRQLFRTSILSALGFAATSGLVACDGDGILGGNRPLSPDPKIPIVGKDDSTGYWYVLKLQDNPHFHADPFKNLNALRVARGTSPPAGTPQTDPDYVEFATEDWYRRLCNNGKVTPAPKGQSFTIGRHSFTPDPDGKLPADQLGYLQGHMRQTTAIWNEIGKS